nr:hypothetical protein [Tanacetum cinerariifolium]
MPQFPLYLSFPNLKLAVIEWREKLQVAQRRIDKDPHNASLKKQEAEILKEYSTTKKDEGKLLMQKAKIDWLCEGDKNGKIFHTVIKGRLIVTGLRLSVMKKGRDLKTVSNEDAEIMVRSVSNEEVKAALFDICDNKAPQKSLDFLEASWQMFSFQNKMIKWIMVCIRNASFTININNERFGYFKGGRGLRHGDPISPYIFTLVMQVFSLVLVQQIKDDGKFKYHWGCKDQKISHLCFADDLLVLCYGDLKSMQVIKRAMETFSSISGLHPNIGKSTIFFGNVQDHVKPAILSILPFKAGSLSVLYLRVPLITKQLSFTDYKCLIDRVKTKASVFILSKIVIKYIDKILKGILWCQGDLSKGKAKIAWKQVCKTKEEGGLGIKDLNLWNEWLEKHLRAKRQHIICKVRDGSSIFLWHDKWWGPEPISKLMSMDVVIKEDLDSNVKIKDMIAVDKWRWLAAMCPDSLNHLFFECKFTKEIWCKMRTIAEINFMPNKWEDIMNLMSVKKHNMSIKSVLGRLILATCVYFIWTERNKRHFTTQKQSCKDMIENVVYHIRMKLASLTVKRTEQVEEVSRKWKIAFNVKNEDGKLLNTMDLQ